jgi:hypothetical protein
MSTIKDKILIYIDKLKADSGDTDVKPFEDVADIVKGTENDILATLFSEESLRGMTLMDISSELIIDDITIPAEEEEPTLSSSLLPSVGLQQVYPESSVGSYSSEAVASYDLKTDGQLMNSSPIYVSLISDYIKETKALNVLTIGSRAIDLKTQKFLSLCIDKGIIDNNTMDCFISLGFTIGLTLEQFNQSITRREENKPLGTSRQKANSRLLEKVKINMRTLIVLSAYCRVNLTWTQISKNTRIAGPINENIRTLDSSYVQKWWNSRFVWESLLDENKAYFFDNYFAKSLLKMVNYIYSLQPEIVENNAKKVKYIEFKNATKANMFKVSYRNKFFVPRPKLMINLKNGAVPVLSSFISLSHLFAQKLNDTLFRDTDTQGSKPKLFLKYTKMYDNQARMLNAALGRLYNFDQNRKTRKWQENPEVSNTMSRKYIDMYNQLQDAKLIETDIDYDDVPVDIESIKTKLSQTVELKILAKSKASVIITEYDDEPQVEENRADDDLFDENGNYTGTVKQANGNLIKISANSYYYIYENYTVEDMLRDLKERKPSTDAYYFTMDGKIVSPKRKLDELNPKSGIVVSGASKQRNKPAVVFDKLVM